MASPQSDDLELDLDKLKTQIQEEGSVACPLAGCSETFKSIWGLRFHLKKNSCNNPKFKCDKCKDVFSTRIILQQHSINCGESVVDVKPSQDSDRDTTCKVGQDLRSTSETNALKRVSDDSQEDNETHENKKRKVSESSEKHSDIPLIEATDSIGIDIISTPDANTDDNIPSNTQRDPSPPTPGGDTSLLEYGSQALKRKRGRPKKSPKPDAQRSGESSSAAGPDSISQQTDIADIVTTSNTKDTSRGLQLDEEVKTPKKKRGKSKAAYVKTPQSSETVVPTRRSSRSTSKKVNYAQFDVDEDEDDDDDDDATSDIKSVEKPKSRRGRPKKIVIDVDESQNKGNEIAVGHDDTKKQTNNDQESISINYISLSVKDVEKLKHMDHPKKIVIIDSNSTDEVVIVVEDDDNNANYRGLEETPSKHDDQENISEDTTLIEKDVVKPQRGCPKNIVAIDCASQSEENVIVADVEPDVATGNNSVSDSTPSKTEDDNVKIPKRKGRPKKIAVIKNKGGETEVPSNSIEIQEKALRKKAKRGQKISCLNKCGKKFSTFNGYKAHIIVCGRAQEEREIMKCEQCEKEYTTKEGLRYHMKAAHKEKEEEVINEKDVSITDEAVAAADTPRRQIRQAAVRAMEKVHDLKKDIKTGLASAVRQPCRSKTVDGYVIKHREGLVTPALVNQWREELKKNGSVVCPNQGCNEEYTSAFVLQTHYLKCGFEMSPFQCKLCHKEFLSIIGARYHVENVHLSEDDKNSGGSDDKDRVHGVTLEDANQESDYDVEISDLDDDEDEMMESEDKNRSTSKWWKRDKRLCKIMISIGPSDEIYQENEKWHNKNFGKEVVFSEHIPMVHHWRRVETRVIADYIPTSPSSPHFLISRPTSNGHHNTDDTQLSLFTSLPKDDSGNYGDRIFYTGGPVWGLSWCPTPDTKRNVDQYLVVSTHKTFETVYHSHTCHKEKGILQLWNIGTLSNSSSRSGDSPTLALCIAHNYGPIWKMSWCPTGAWQSPKTTMDENVISRLGLLAIACGDGIVHILSIPHPDKLLGKLPVYKTDEKNNNSFNKVMVHAASTMDLYPCSVNVNYDGQRGMAVCVEWSLVKPFHRVAAGFSDGSVAVWNLASKSCLLRKSLDHKQNTLRMAPFVLFKAHPGIVRDLAWCPSHQDFMVTNGHDHAYKIWDLKSPLTPLIVQRKGYVCEIEWPLQTNGFVYGEQELYHKDQPSLRHYLLSSIDHVRLICPHGCSLLSLSFNNWISVMASSNIAGDVFLSKLLCRNSPRNKWYLYSVHLEDRNLSGDSQTVGAKDRQSTTTAKTTETTTTLGGAESLVTSAESVNAKSPIAESTNDKGVFVGRTNLENTDTKTFGGESAVDKSTNADSTSLDNGDTKETGVESAGDKNSNAESTNLESKVAGAESAVDKSTNAGSTILESTDVIGVKSIDAEISNAESSDAKVPGAESIDGESANAESSNLKSIDPKAIGAESIDGESTNAESSNAKVADVENADAKKQKENVLKQKCVSIKEAISSSRLVFQDRNVLQFKSMISTDDKECKENPTTYRYNSSTLQSIRKVRWNPNKQALTWIASGGASGLVRIHHVKEHKSRDVMSKQT